MLTEKILDKLTPYLADIFREEEAVSLPTLPRSAEALVVWTLEKIFHKTIVWVSDSPQSLEIMHRDILTLSPYPNPSTINHQPLTINHSLLYYPAWENPPCPPSRAALGGRQTGQNVSHDPDITGHRLNALLALLGSLQPNPQSAFRIPKSFILATCIQSLMQKTVAPANLLSHALSLSVGDEMDLDDVSKLFGDFGYVFTAEVQDKGEASARGGLLDVWPPTETWPVRVEFVGTQVESIRSFNPVDQRSVEKLNNVTIPPATEWMLMQKPVHSLGLQPSTFSLPTTILSYLPDDVIFVWSDPDSIKDHASIYEEIIAESGAQEIAVSFTSLCSRIGRRREALQLFIGDCADGAALLQKRRYVPPVEAPSPWRDGKAVAALPRSAILDIKPVRGVFEMPREVFQPDIMEGARQRLLSEISARARRGQTVILFFDTQGSLDHFVAQRSEDGEQTTDDGGRTTDKSQLRNPQSAIPRSGTIAPAARQGPHLPRRRRELAPPRRGLHLHVGILSEGFVSDEMGLIIVSESDLYGRRKIMSQRYASGVMSPRPQRIRGTRIADLTDIEPGDLVVHVEHGRGRYLGLYEIMFNGQFQEALTIEYADNAKLHVPVSQAHLLSRYVGISRQRAELHRLGGKRWNKEKSAAQRSILDMASSLLETQAERSLLDGHAFSPDTPWQHDFEAAFPYEETHDQQQAVIDVKRDMQSSRPMDRLVCGDAGYGKTEVAMRASFKTVMDGRQVAVLVPTTVLAQQHFQTFTERMSAYPIRVEMLSRFCSGSKHADILRGLCNGTVDVVIGTHSLLQLGFRFKNLGLVVIDEEQRFGVIHKERLKHIKRLVDVLTLTATPIPRTLYMSMTGASDMSLMQTPPRERMAIETIVTRNTDDVVREAILREINREGQVFYLHNRVMTIEQVKTRLERLVPEARIEIAHGQMASSELASVMRRFVAGEFEVLLCTTIIESGMDIPRANTILIDRADRFGMADLYQLRGRVGRSSHKAYAYLLLPSHGHLDSSARKRITAVKKYSSLSAGFNLALRDLEIRGAGNLLGAEQSGHINSLGFGLYCQLLKQTVTRLKGEPVPPVIDVDVRLDFISLSPRAVPSEISAIIPYSYIEDERLRIDAYRRIAEASSSEDIFYLRTEFRDRFGPIPPPLERLLKIAELRIVAVENNIRHVETRNGKVMLIRHTDYLMKGKRFPRLLKSTVDEQLDEIIAMIRTLSV